MSSILSMIWRLTELMIVLSCMHIVAAAPARRQGDGIVVGGREPDPEQSSQSQHSAANFADFNAAEPFGDLMPAAAAVPPLSARGLPPSGHARQSSTRSSRYNSIEIVQSENKTTSAASPPPLSDSINEWDAFPNQNSNNPFASSQTGFTVPSLPPMPGNMNQQQQQQQGGWPSVFSPTQHAAAAGGYAATAAAAGSSQQPPVSPDSYGSQNQSTYQAVANQVASFRATAPPFGTSSSQGRAEDIGATASGLVIVKQRLTDN